MLNHLRQAHPGARLIALVPPGYPVDVLQDRCDEVQTTPQATYGLASPGALIKLIASIRNERYAVFVVMFHSPKLRVVSALSGAPQRMCYTADNRYFPVSLNFATGISTWVARNIQGRITYARIWWIVNRQKIGK
jgi:ADP-heptose:LPS heptosyltransferase